MNPYLLVSGDFVKTGGMDLANYSLASYLAERGAETHLVAHRADERLLKYPSVVFHRVPKILSSYTASEPLLDRVGRGWARKLSARGGRVIVNGGNCGWGDINWVHYVHAAYSECDAGSTWLRLKRRIQSRFSLAREARTVRSAKLVIANSKRTKSDLGQRLAIPESRVRAVYYGIDDALFHPPDPGERSNARMELGWPQGKPVVVFIGALGDRRKGFDTVFDAWLRLCGDSAWDANLIVVGSGAELPEWTKRAESAGLSIRIEFLGKRSDVPRILAAADALLAPTRYEAYGIAVHEALCCGLPAFVTRTAGVAEQYTADLQNLLISDPNDAADMAARLRSWHAGRDFYRNALASLSARLRKRSWSDMAAEIIDFVEAS